MLLDWIGYIYLIMLILFIVGFYTTPPILFEAFTLVVKVAMAIFLFVRFNPYRKEKIFTEVDRRIILYTAYFILLSSFTDYNNQFMTAIQTTVTKIIDEILHRLHLK